MRESGADIELFYNDKLKIKPCTGCFNCWLKTPGVCSHKDDMAWLLPKMRDADVMVYATPVYGYGMTGQMKNLLEILGDQQADFGALFLQDDVGRHRRAMKKGRDIGCRNASLLDQLPDSIENPDRLIAGR